MKPFALNESTFLHHIGNEFYKKGVPKPTFTT